VDRRYETIRKLVLDAALIATSVVLATAVHSVGGKVAGSMWVPMWWGAFVGGMLLGPIHGFIIGILTPFVSFIVRGLPPYPFWFVFSIEIGIYGFMWGVSEALIGRFSKEKKYILLFFETIMGIVMGKLAAALILMFIIPQLVPFVASNFFAAFMTVLVYWTLKSLPGILLILIVGPVLVRTLNRALYRE